MTFALAAPARADDRLPASLPTIAFDQRLGERLPLGAEFRDEAGRAVRLGDYFAAGKPVVLVLAYYRCPMLCNQVLEALLTSLRDIAPDAGADFHVVAVSFDARETPELAAAKKASYVEAYGRPGAGAGWHFLTGAQPSIDAVCAAAGFRYTYDARLDQFAHASGIMVAAPDGTLARYFYGIRYPPRDVRLALAEASAGRVGSPVDRLMLLCYRWDPATGRYSLAVLNAVRAGGLLTLVALGTLVTVALRRERRRNGRAEDVSPPMPPPAADAPRLP